ncbi:MAG: hypothetical protein LN416_01405 [Candidatus Thermoplasmatota archaeon]|nr:hypothetical protein [Candidatus Thermoplasmatota archaeon]
MSPKKAEKVKITERKAKRDVYRVEGINTRDLMSKKFRGILNKELKDYEVAMLGVVNTKKETIITIAHTTPEDLREKIIEVGSVGKDAESAKKNFIDGIKRAFE